MNIKRAILPLALAAIIGCGVFLAACGSDGDSAPDQSPVATTPADMKPAAEKPANVKPAKIKPPEASPDGGVPPPVSAGDRKPNAPDNVISDRPGGPNHKDSGK